MKRKKSYTSIADNNFNLLRLVAAVFVLVSHSFGILDKGWQQPGIWYGNTYIILSDVGLATFFTISGFLVTKSLLNANSYKHYFWKRFLRIAPALTVVSFLCIGMGALVTTFSLHNYLFNPITIGYFLTNVSLIQNAYILPGVFSTLRNDRVNASIWTIPLEVRCYVGLAVLSVLGILQRKWLLFSGFILLEVLRICVDELHLINLPHVDLHVYLLYGSYFYLGILSYCFKDDVVLKWFYANILLAVTFITAETILHAITLSIFFAYCILIIGNSKAVLSLRGYDVSYGLYLYAFPVQQLVLLYLGYSVNAWVHIAVSTTIAVLLGLLSWIFIEKPFLSRKTLF